MHIVFTLIFLSMGCSHDPGSNLEAARIGTNPFTRLYELGESVKYRMTAENQQPDGKESYEATSAAVVRRADNGAFFEETGWTGLTLNGSPVALSPKALSFRETISLDPEFQTAQHQPNVGDAEPYLAGPIFDLMNFYVDLQLGARLSALEHPGDHVYVKYSQPSSYADPEHSVLVGEVCIDFDLTLKEVDHQNQTATLVVKHVPPSTACVALAAPWMQVPVVDGVQNNHVQVNRNDDSTYTVAVGKEDIDVEIKVAIGSGKILVATMYNPVDILERVCVDANYTNCKLDRRYRILRQIEMRPI